MATLFVGRKRKEFGVHKKLLCDTSDFFAKAFNSNFKEGIEGIMYLPADSPGSISLLVEWLYRGVLPDRNSEQHIQDLYHLYLFAEKILHTKLRDDTMDMIQDVCSRHDKYVDIELVRKVYKRALDGCPLREFCLDLTIFQYTIDLAARTQARMKSDGLANHVQENGKLRREYIENMRDRIGGDFDFFSEFFDRFETEFTGITVENPRIRDDGAVDSRCRYHCHRGEDICREWDREEDQTED